MADEVSGLIDSLSSQNTVSIAGLNFIEGILGNKSVIVVRCGIGKVNAAMCSQLLIDRFHVKAIINTGVAGGISDKVEIGDIVISTAALHHDFDTTVFGYELGQIPGMDDSRFSADPQLVQTAVSAATDIVGKKRTHLGLVVSGDQFISTIVHKEKLAQVFNPTCAEMEGAAIAHISYLNELPFVIIRTISDKADNSAPANFDKFTKQIILTLNSIVSTVVANYSVCSKA